MNFYILKKDDNRMPCIRAKAEFEKNGWQVDFSQIQNGTHTFSAFSTRPCWDFFTSYSL